MPSYFPENDAPLPQDREPRSLQKINSLLQGIDSKSAPFSIPEYDRIDLTYDAFGRATGIFYLKNNATVASLSLQYDGDDNLTSVVKS